MTSTPLDRYIEACGTKSVMEELHDIDSMKPPTPEEIRTLIDYLAKLKLSPMVAGSASAFHHIVVAFGAKAKGKNLSDLWRPTKDVDLWVSGKLPAPPAGWRRDMEAVGAPSWISPSGGYVDFLIKGDMFPNGATTGTMTVSSDSPKGVPVAGIFDVMRAKLGTSRMKDLSDVVDLLHVVNSNATYKAALPAFKKSLKREQKEDMETAELYFGMNYAGSLNIGVNKMV